MRTLVQHLTKGASGSQLLPDMHPLLTEATVRIRRGQLVMLTAPSSGGKSMLALWYVVKRNPGRVLYFSLDTSLTDMLKRSAAIITGRSVQEIEDALEAGGDDWVEEIVTPLSERVRWCVNARDMQDVDEELLAYRELYGVNPDVVVVDVLLNLDASEDWGGIMRTAAELHALAHERDITVFALHHNADRRADQTLPSPKAEALMKISQYPETMLSLALDQAASVMRISPVKNRNGKGYPDASTYVTIPVDMESMRLFETDAEALAHKKRKEWS